MGAGRGHARRRAREGAGLTPGGRRLAGPATALAATLIAADGLFLHPRGFFVAPHATVTLPVLDGTFATSRRAVARARLVDLSLAGPDGRRALDRAAWTEREPRSSVRITVGGPGTYVVGAAVADAGGPAICAKTLVAVTDGAGHLLPREALRTGSAAVRPLGYQAEIVPLVDPYALGVGDTLPVRALAGGRPLARATIHAGGTIGTSAVAIPAQALPTDGDGRADIRLTHDGHWFVAFAHDRGPAAGTPRGGPHGATLTFGVLPAGAR